jgi:hypothetical protein
MKPMPGTTIQLVSVIIKSIMLQLRVLYSSLKTHALDKTKG